MRAEGRKKGGGARAWEWGGARDGPAGARGPSPLGVEWCWPATGRRSTSARTVGLYPGLMAGTRVAHDAPISGASGARDG